jgi:hypothetical protein
MCDYRFGAFPGLLIDQFIDYSALKGRFMLRKQYSVE